MAENRALKAEILSLKQANKNHSSTESVEEGTKMEVATQPDRHMPINTTEGNPGTESPPPKRRATTLSKQAEETDITLQAKTVDEELLNSRLRQFEEKFENMLTKFEGSITARIFALENARFSEGGSGQIGPIKTTKPYARPPVTESTRINLETAQPITYVQ